jgi:site-specific DNA-methyltransferase (adenine-specific)/adenine-specific DNA-methyltransferase
MGVGFWGGQEGSKTVKYVKNDYQDMNKERQQKMHELLKRGLKLAADGEEMPAEWARELFPPERREYELGYYGKKNEEQILADTMAVPFQPVSTFGRNGNDWQNKLIFGDNLQAMKTLLQMKERGELASADGTPGIRLIYIDPPFSTRRDFHGSQDQKAYQDRIAGADFLEFLRERLVFLKELLSNDGNIFLHLDWKKGHYAKVLMDEIFGENKFVNEIVWRYRRWPSKSKCFQKMHDVIYWYSLANPEKRIWNQQYEPLSASSLKQWKGKKRTDVLSVGGTRHSEISNEESKGVAMSDVWELSQITAPFGEFTGYPTQKPEELLERIISATSSEGDLVLDAFAGSGTTCAVAEKIKRRWIGIDCGKLAIYTIQKRILNLRTGIGNSGKSLATNPFTLYNAGLYDFETLKQLPWEGWRSIALQLFECKDDPHKIRGFQMDGRRQGSSVFVFNHFEKGKISRETIADLHVNIGKQVGERCFVIAPRGAFLFQEDYIELNGVRYYALRIPYSYINELHRREFSALTQPNDEMAVNETVEAVGFDFIQPPMLELEVKTRGTIVSIKIKKFESRARVKGKERVGKHDALSMVMVDFDYNGSVFDLDRVFYAAALKDNQWKIEFLRKDVVGNVMLVFLDIYGNESRGVIEKRKLVSKK